MRNADAARVAQTLRALLSGGGGHRAAPTSAPTQSMFGSQIDGSASPNAQRARRGARVDRQSVHQRRRRGGGNTGNVTIQADVANNALIIMGPEPIYNNLRTIIDRLDVRRAQVFVEALIVEVTADKAAQFGIQWQVLQGLNKQNVQGFGGTNFGAPDSGNNIVSGSVNLSNLGQGLNLGHPQRHDRHPRAWRDHQSRAPHPLAGAGRQRQHPVHADAAHARQRGSADHRRPEHPVRDRAVRDDGQRRRRSRRSRRSSGTTSACCCA